ncbi:MAG: amino acid racemase [Candidatus Aminicenantes bacterium]|jgi:aspartate racemase
MAKRIGIIGGISHESTIKYYEFILKKYFARQRDYHYPEVVIFSLDLAKLVGFEERGDIDGYIRYLATAIKSLEKAGAEFICIAANSPHSVYDILEKKASVPLLSIVEITALEAQRLKMKKLLLIGIKHTMQSPFYRDVFMKHGMEVITPSEEEQDEINDIIFKELVLGIYKNTTRNKLLDIINNYDEDGVILGCTELSLAINQEDTKIKLLNTLELHALAALNFSIKE